MYHKIYMEEVEKHINEREKRNTNFNVNKKNCFNEFPLMFSIKNNHTEVVKLLMEVDHQH